MADIKTSIPFLCKHLNFIFGLNMKPEMFRLAKLNKPDPTLIQAFWELLKHLVELESTTDIVNAVKEHFLTELQYKRLQFYSLPKNMSEGSRELLIAFGYLLAHDYLEKFIKRAIETSPLDPNFKTIKIPSSITDKYSFSTKQLKTEEDIQNAILWINGRTEANKKAILEYQDSINKISANLTKLAFNAVPNIEKLSVPEILAFNDSSYANDFLRDTKDLIKTLENHEKWLQNQSVFWQWMDSVLAEGQKDICVVHPPEIDDFVSTTLPTAR